MRAFEMDLTRPPLRAGSLSAFGAALLIAACSSTASPSAAKTNTTELPAVTASVAQRVPVTASDSSTPLVFTSTRYRYTITLPRGWSATPAGITWLGTDAPTSESPAVDLFGPAGGGFDQRGAFAFAVPTKSQLAAWVADGIAKIYEFHSDTCPRKPDSVKPVTIGGQPGMLEALNCGILINTAYTVANGYGYRFVFRDPAIHAATDPTDHSQFTTMLGSIVFH